MKPLRPILAAVTLILFGNLAAARAEVSPTPGPADLKSHIQMHEKMSEAHKNAADCLKEGKPHEECRDQFMKACQESGGKSCGMGPGRGKGKGRSQ